MKKQHIFILLISVLIWQGCNSNNNASDGPEPPSGYMNETFIKIAIGLGWLDLIDLEPEVPADIEAFKDIEYKKVNDVSLQLDIYRRKELPTPAPTIIFIHGGAWRTGKRQDYLPYLIDYAEKGYIAVTVSYRLQQVAKFPAAVGDVICAIKWIKSHAGEYGIDPTRIALLGASAGGHLSLMAGYAGDEPMFNDEPCPSDSSAKVKAVINFYGPVDLTTPYARGRNEVKDFLGGTYDEYFELYHLASPITYVSKESPPTLTFHGTIDSLVPVSQADSLDTMLKRMGVPHEYYRLKGWPHAMDLAVEVNEYCQYHIDKFLKKYL